jgi:hypothetical protein
MGAGWGNQCYTEEGAQVTRKPQKNKYLASSVDDRDFPKMTFNFQQSAIKKARFQKPRDPLPDAGTGNSADTLLLKNNDGLSPSTFNFQQKQIDFHRRVPRYSLSCPLLPF